MTLRVIETFDWLPPAATSAQINDLLTRDGYYVWGTILADYSLVPGAIQGYAMQIEGEAIPASLAVKPLGVNGTGATVGARLYRAQNSVISPALCLFDMTSGQPQVSVTFDAYGVINVWRGAPTTGVLVGNTPPASFPSNIAFYAEASATISATVGSVTVKINAGVSTALNGVVIDLTTVNTQAAPTNNVDSVGWGTQGAIAGGQIRFDDFYALDSAGSVNNAFLGNVKGMFLPTNGPGEQTQLSLGGSEPAATNWQSVQDYALDEAQFVSTSTAGDYDLYTVAPRVTPGTIFAVQVRYAARQDDATEAAAQSVLASGATTVTGAERLLNETQTYYEDIWETDPNTSAGWTPTDANSVQIGVKKAA